MAPYGFAATNPPNTLSPLLTTFSSYAHLSQNISEETTLLPESSTPSSQDLTPTTPISLSLSSLSNPFSPESSMILIFSGISFFFYLFFYP